MIIRDGTAKFFLFFVAIKFLRKLNSGQKCIGLEISRRRVRIDKGMEPKGPWVVGRYYLDALLNVAKFQDGFRPIGINWKLL